MLWGVVGGGVDLGSQKQKIIGLGNGRGWCEEMCWGGGVVVVDLCGHSRWCLGGCFVLGYGQSIFFFFPPSPAVWGDCFVRFYIVALVFVVCWWPGW